MATDATTTSTPVTEVGGLLTGQHVVVVGGSSGMGKAVAISALHRGASVTLIGRTASKLEAAAAEMTGTVKTAAVDCEDPAAVEAYFGGLEADSINHLVLTAGRAVPGPSSFLETSYADFMAQITAKVGLQWAGARFGAPKIAAGGSITFFTGALSRRPGKGSHRLAVANAAIESLTKALANDLGPKIRVNTISPGLTRTSAFDVFGMSEEAKDGMFKGFGSKIPAGRAGLPVDIGEATVGLLSNGWISGAILDVDGGAVIRP